MPIMSGFSCPDSFASAWSAPTILFTCRTSIIAYQGQCNLSKKQGVPLTLNIPFHQNDVSKKELSDERLDVLARFVSMEPENEMLWRDCCGLRGIDWVTYIPDQLRV